MTTVGLCEAPIRARVRSLGLSVVPEDSSHASRLLDRGLSAADFEFFGRHARHLGTTKEFRDVVGHFGPAEGTVPAGFRVEFELDAGGVLRADLVRDISRGEDGEPRPTGVLFSADSANPYEVADIAPLLANLTCNPGIVYDLFINNPEANVGGEFATREEVIDELGRVLGPGCDISVELDDPFEKDFSQILEEAESFRELLSRWRVVVKVPHTGPVNAENVGQLLAGDKRLDSRFDAPATGDAFRGHRLALRLREHGFRVNFTLMFEPYQTQLALQARPYFINSFVRNRLTQSRALAGLVADYDECGDEAVLLRLRDYLLGADYLSSRDLDYPLSDALALARDIVAYRRLSEEEGNDGLDGMRHNLRALREARLPDTRLIVCSMEGPQNFRDVDRVLADPAYADMSERVVITAEPRYLARFSSTNQVVSYQRRFMNAAATKTTAPIGGAR